MGLEAPRFFFFVCELGFHEFPRVASLNTKAYSREDLRYEWVLHVISQM
jgi:hypothetical protein